MRKSQFLKNFNPLNLESFNLPIHLKTNLITRKSFNTPEQTQHHGNNPNASQKNFKHFRRHLHTPPKQLKPLTEKISTSLKNSYTGPSSLTETTSNTQTKSQPIPEKIQAPCEKFSIPPEKISTPYLPKNSQHLPKKSHLYQNFQPLPKKSQYISQHPELKVSQSP